MEYTYTITTLANKTGLSQHTIRAWERRYRALSPSRSETNRRLYVEQDLERLSLLKRVVESGHSIGQVAQLPRERLLELTEPAEFGVAAASESFGDTAAEHFAACKKALLSLDPVRLEESLVRGATMLGIAGLLDGVVLPLIAKIDSGWLDGSVSISQEHMASAVLRGFLSQVRRSLLGSTHSPRVIVTTPSGQHHEIGAMIVAIVAAMQSWNVTYLGPNLPAKEIAEAVRKTAVSVVVLSLVFPNDDPNLGAELHALRAELGPGIPILVGGRAAEHYAQPLQEIRAIHCPDLIAFREDLGKIARGERIS